MVGEVPVQYKPSALTLSFRPKTTTLFHLSIQPSFIRSSPSRSHSITSQPSMGSVEDVNVAMLPRDEADEEACMQALQLASASILPMTLKAAIELGVLEILVKGCGGPFGKPIMTPIDVAAHLKTENPQVCCIFFFYYCQLI